MRIDINTIARIQYNLLAEGIDNVQIGANNNGQLTFRFGYWEEAKDSVTEMINSLLPDHLCLELNLVDEDEECGGELWNYKIIRK